MRTLFLFTCLITFFAYGKAPIYPENGVHRMKSWYYGERNEMSDPLREALISEGVEPKKITFNYDYIQDITLFAEDGTLLLMADVPYDSEILRGYTMGVVNEEDGPMSLNVTRVRQSDVGRMGLKTRTMEWTFVEGGNLISGKYPNGESFAIINQSVVQTTQRLFFYRKRIEITLEEAKSLIANDFGIKADNLYIVQYPSHIDLIMFALPNGTILLHDHNSALDVIEREIKKLKQEKKFSFLVKSDELKRLIQMRDIYRTGGLVRYNNEGEKIGFLPLERDANQQMLDQIEEVLAPNFHVRRVAGYFKEGQTFQVSKDGHPYFLNEKINFFNGFSGLNQNGETFIITNTARSPRILEEYWREILASEGINSERVHFVGDYSSGAGVDCMGAPAG